VNARQDFSANKTEYRNIVRNIKGMRERRRHADRNNSPCVANYFEMFALRTSGQSRVSKAMLSSSLEGRNNNKKSGRVA
jgi:hypothetical protein